MMHVTQRNRRPCRSEVSALSRSRSRDGRHDAWQLTKRGEQAVRSIRVQTDHRVRAASRAPRMSHDRGRGPQEEIVR
jgi:hypothetical protein